MLADCQNKSTQGQYVWVQDRRYVFLSPFWAELLNSVDFLQLIFNLKLRHWYTCARPLAKPKQAYTLPLTAPTNSVRDVMWWNAGWGKFTCCQKMWTWTRGISCFEMNAGRKFSHSAVINLHYGCERWLTHNSPLGRLSQHCNLIYTYMIYMCVLGSVYVCVCVWMWDLWGNLSLLFLNYWKNMLLFLFASVLQGFLMWFVPLNAANLISDCSAIPKTTSLSYIYIYMIVLSF